MAGVCFHVCAQRCGSQVRSPGAEERREARISMQHSQFQCCFLLRRRNTMLQTPFRITLDMRCIVSIRGLDTGSSAGWSSLTYHTSFHIHYAMDLNFCTNENHVFHPDLAPYWHLDLITVIALLHLVIGIQRLIHWASDTDKYIKNGYINNPSTQLTILQTTVAWNRNRQLRR